MRNFLIYTLLFISAASYGQKKYKTIKRPLSSVRKEIYRIDKKTKQKEGFYYVVNTQTEDTLVVGNYLNDNKVGLWKYFETDTTLFYTYNYDSNILSNPNNVSGGDSTYIKSNNEYVFASVDNPQLYGSYKNAAVTELAMAFTLPISILKEGKCGRFIYSFVVDETGVLKNIVVEQSSLKEFDTSVIKGLQALKENWLPAKKDGKVCDSKTFLFIDIANDKSKVQDIENTPYLWHLDLIYGGISSKVTRI